MIDFHSHIIPNIDDGSKSVEMSLDMLTRSYQQGITDIVATSHCEPHGPETIDDFIKIRTERYNVLSGAIKASGKPVPNIHLASEVGLMTDISEFDNLSKLCIEGTNYIMIEMPYKPWKDWAIDAVYMLTINGFTPIIAHIERFMSQDEKFLASLFELNVVYQINCNVLTSSRFMKLADLLLSKGHAHLLGTDSHNLTTRKPNFDIASNMVLKRYGQDCLDYFEINSKHVLANEPIKYYSFPVPEKQSVLKKIFKK